MSCVPVKWLAPTMPVASIPGDRFLVTASVRVGIGTTHTFGHAVVVMQFRLSMRMGVMLHLRTHRDALSENNTLG